MHKLPVASYQVLITDIKGSCQLAVTSDKQAQEVEDIMGKALEMLHSLKEPFGAGRPAAGKGKEGVEEPLPDRPLCTPNNFPQVSCLIKVSQAFTSTPRPG